MIMDSLKYIWLFCQRTRHMCMVIAWPKLGCLLLRVLQCTNELFCGNFHLSGLQAAVVGLAVLHDCCVLFKSLGAKQDGGCC